MNLPATPTIRVLAPEVADAIAAGEVVERPASVVKELIENALDAGAGRVSVELRGAGRTLVRVADDGAGIAPEELPMAFLRHATSKVAELADLSGISSFGFRGEALASIAAVAEVECRSRGARIRVRGGRHLEEGSAAGVAGTIFEVRDLFSNTPARLHFLRTDATETAVAVQVARVYALLHPGVRFEMAVDGRRVLATTGDGDRLRVAAAIYGDEVARSLLEVAGDTVRGMVSGGRVSRGTREAIVLAVNGRPIQSRALQFALEQAYLGALEKGRYPIAMLDVAVDPATIDVNVHPAKREVRFRDERSVFEAVQRAVRGALAGTGTHAAAAAAPLAAFSSAAQVTWQPVVHDAPAILAPGPEPGKQGMPMRPLGQVLDGYLVAEGSGGLVVVDQHAAHERLIYNRLLSRLAGGGGDSQPLLLAQVIEVDPAQVAAASDAAGTLSGLGFEIETFGPGAIRVLAVPLDTPADRIVEVVSDLLATLTGARPDDRRERAAASVACHSAVRFGDRLEPAEQRRLLEDLEAAGADALTCPHGRPTRWDLTEPELRNRFRRNY